MPEKMTEEQIYEEAKKRVRAKKDLYVHIAVYIVVNAFIFMIWFITSQGFPWYLFPLGGWGIGLIFHILDVFVWQRQADTTAIEKEAEKLRKSQGK